jgi:hypothetical protein
LEEKKFFVRTRWLESTSVSAEGKTLVIKQLEQLLFTNNSMIQRSRRFISDFMAQIDATFATNILKMPLVNVVGIDNCGLTFNSAFSFIRSESAHDMRFILTNLRILMFNDCPIPRVIIADQGRGLQSALKECMPGVYAQLCEWHALENMRQCVYKNRTYKSKDELLWLWEHMRNWLQCDDLTKVDEMRAILYSHLKPAEHNYIEKNWRPKKPFIIRAYTRAYPNLGCNSSQRNEGSHHHVKALTDPRAQLDKTASAIIKHIEYFEQQVDQAVAESRMKTHLPGTMKGMESIRHLQGRISFYAMDKIKMEWIKATDLGQDDWQSDCNCQSKMRYCLPCSHTLLPFIGTQRLLPLRYIHPRWFLDGPSCSPTNWKMPPPVAFFSQLPRPQDRADPDDNSLVDDSNMRSKTTSPHYLSHSGALLLTKTLHAQETFHSTLKGEQAQEYALKTKEALETLQAEYRDLQEESGSINRQTQLELPPIPVNKFLKRTVQKGPIKRWAMTGTEVAERAAKIPASTTRTRQASNIPPASTDPGPQTGGCRTSSRNKKYQPGFWKSLAEGNATKGMEDSEFEDSN